MKLIAVLAGLVASHIALATGTSPQGEPVFKGKIGFSAKESIPDWPAPVMAPAGAPNIVLIILDDVGFGDTEPFGGPVHTPVLNRLAAEGLRYNRFHTAGVCSPTRAALLSGRNHHRVGYGEFGGVGYPGYNGIWKKSTVSIAEVLKRNGYSTAAFGKWHNTPEWEITPPIGPFDRWPTGLGFEYFYGFMGGQTSQWEPQLWRNTGRALPPATAEQGYHLTSDITDEAIRWIHAHESLAPEKPYFVYFAAGAAHVPHHVSKEWIEKYQGRFDQGWDKLREETFARQKKLGVVPANAELTVRPDELPAWDSLSVDEKRLFARQMEVFAAFVAHTDHEIGRLLQVVKDGDRADNTMVLLIVGDNGDEAASGGIKGSDMIFMDRSIKEQLQTMDKLGGPLNDRNVYSAAWAWAGSTPFQWMKRVASHFGGTRNPLIVSWPSRISDSGGLRSQFTHVNDVAATLYEAAGIEFPRVVDGIEQLPLDGVSFADTFEHADASERHQVQYFEIRGNRAIYHDGWVAAARHEVPWIRETRTNSGFEADRWELYNIADDFSQARDVAARYPGKLKALQTLFDTEARKNDVYPLGAGSGAGPPSLSNGTGEFAYYADFPGLLTMGLEFESSHRIVADVKIPERGAEGVIIAFGTREVGFALFIKSGRLIYEKNVFGARNVITAPLLQTGEVELSYEFIRTSDKVQYGGVGHLYVNGRRVGEAKITAQGPSVMLYAFMDIGHNFPSPVSREYQAPFKFTGTIEKVRVRLE